MNCPNCGAEVLSDNEKFCRKCGFKLADQEVKKATLVSDTTSKVKCRSCNNLIDSNLRICPYSDLIRILHQLTLLHQLHKQAVPVQVTVTVGAAVV